MKRFTAIMVVMVFTAVLLTGCVNDNSVTNGKSTPTRSSSSMVSPTGGNASATPAATAGSSQVSSAAATPTPAPGSAASTIDSTNNTLTDLENTLNDMDTITETDLTVPPPVEN